MPSRPRDPHPSSSRRVGARRRASALVVLVCCAGLAAATAAAGATSRSATRLGGFSLVIPDELRGGDSVRVVVDRTEVIEPTAAMLCNTDTRIAPTADACGPAIAPTSAGSETVVFDVPLTIGQIGADPLALCPAVPAVNEPGARCAIIVEAQGSRLRVAEVGEASGELVQEIVVRVFREDGSVTTVGSTRPPSSTSATTAPPPSTRPPATGLPPVTVGTVPGGPPATLHTVPSAGVPGGPAGGGLAATGAGSTIALVALAAALIDLGYLSCTAGRRSLTRP
jgi:hypothetical protein